MSCVCYFYFIAQFVVGYIIYFLWVKIDESIVLKKYEHFNLLLFHFHLNYFYNQFSSIKYLRLGYSNKLFVILIKTCSILQFASEFRQLFILLMLFKVRIKERKTDYRNQSRIIILPFSKDSILIRNPIVPSCRAPFQYKPGILPGNSRRNNKELLTYTNRIRITAQ